jgi:predicted Rossmann-fold nucleotide-binding protein
VVLDPFGLYDPLKTLIDHLEVEGFVKPGQRELLHWCTTIEEALDICGGQ